MAKILSENEIAALLAERKPITIQQRLLLLKPRLSKRHRDCTAKIPVKGDDQDTHWLDAMAAIRVSIPIELRFGQGLEFSGSPPAIRISIC